MSTKSPRRHVSDIIYDAAAKAASSKAVESQLDHLPALSLYAFVTSLMTLGSRVLALGRIELGIAELISWKRPAMTISALVAYTQLCYHPQWLVLLPLFYFVAKVLIPNYAAKFKITTDDFESDLCLGRDAGDMAGNPVRKDLVPTVLTIPASENEKVRNDRSLLNAIRKGQKKLEDVVKLLDKFDEFINGPAKFADPQTSCVMLVSCTALLLCNAYLLTFISVPIVFSSIGWSILLFNHPIVKEWQEKLELKLPSGAIDYKVLGDEVDKFSRKHVLMDDATLVKKVQIFELQPRGLTARQWLDEDAIFSISSYTPESVERTQRLKPTGESDIMDVLPPEGWFFDLSEEWEVVNNAEDWSASLSPKHIQSDGCWVYDSIDSEDSNWRRRKLIRNCYHNFQ